MHILLTGGAGFIGFHTTKALLARGHTVFAVDEINSYYSVGLKEARLSELGVEKGWRFAKVDIGDAAALAEAIKGETFDVIIHLAAQAGVRYAVENPAAYTHSNLVGHQNILEIARHASRLQHLVYASSSSVYGNDTVAPFSEDARADKPMSYYGATKRSCELLSYSYASLYGLKQTGLRFFTVYGPFGRPDMAYWSFTDAIMRGRPIPVFGQGKLRRDFTYVDDIVDGIVAIAEKPFVVVPGEAPHKVYNLGNHHPEEVLTLIRIIEQATGKSANLNFTEGPPGDVNETYADITRANRDYGFSPKTPLTEGIPRFVDWFRRYHNYR
ncbi:MAG TPA: NAD-dependent epimerase/dehydratase family protein [Rhizomicrobium sp.]|nr:NAD-dependent epimerase/dehydratase family protein [Rhizomicrobium sp.]